MRSGRHYGFQTLKETGGNGWKRVEWLLNLFSVQPLYPCAFLISALCVCLFTLHFFLSHPCVFLCTSACSFSKFHACRTFSLPVVLVASLSYLCPICCSFFLPIVLLSSLSYFYLAVLSNFFSSQSTFFPRCFSRFQYNYTEFTDINVENKKRVLKKKLCASGGNRALSCQIKKRTSCHCTNSPTNDFMMQKTFYIEISKLFFAIYGVEQKKMRLP